MAMAAASPDDKDATSGNNKATTKSLRNMKGVVFGKSIRSHYAVLHVAKKVDDEAPPKSPHEYVVVHVKFQDNPTYYATDMRSWCRRCCKLGDLIHFRGEWDSGNESPRGHKSFVVNAESLDENLMTVLTVRHWRMPQCQEWQQQYRPKVLCDEKKNQPTKNMRIKMDKEQSEDVNDSILVHGGLNKRDKGECVADFLIQVMIQSLSRNDKCVKSEIGADSTDHELRDRAIEALNKGSGVVDAAGGSGYVSMALGIKGVKSTVVDPRESVGKLPKRDRKTWNRLLRGVPPKRIYGDEDPVLMCQPVVPYDSLRAWFAQPPPKDVDTSFRHGDVESIRICDEEHDLLRNCSVIVALHPDEATDVIVDMAVKRRIPFAVVPCCVFSRFFTHRRKPGTKDPVTTYEDLIDYLVSKDESIEKTILPFDGANVALWSVF